MRVLFFGMQSDFSSPSLIALLESGIEVSAVIIPATPLPGRQPLPIQPREPTRVGRSALTLVNTTLHPSILQIAWGRQIPVWEVQRLSHPETLSILAAYQPDFICVACFSLLLPPTLLALPRLGCLNVHPSLLPANRGPTPLFWTFREGHTTTGVTIHFMTKTMDSGDILAQETIDVPDGIRYDQLEALCARLGAALLAQTVYDLSANRAIRIPQDEALSSYHPFPTDEDFIVHASSWSARHVYNFIRSVNDWRRPVELYVHEQRLFVRDALSYSLNDSLPNPEPCYDMGRGVIIPCRVGQVHVLLSSPGKKTF